MDEETYCRMPGEDLTALLTHAEEIERICQKYRKQPSSEKYAGSTRLSLSLMADLIFEHYETPEEDPLTKIGFLLSRLKTRKYLTYHKGVSGRMYNTAENSADWLLVPEQAKTDHSFDFSSQDLHFAKDGMTAMLYDLWIGTRDSFDQSFAGYREFMEKVKNGGN